MFQDQYYPPAEQPAHRLYGGAVTAHVPRGMRDVSLVRPLRDSQEMFVDLASGDTLTFELMRAGTAPVE